MNALDNIKTAIGQRVLTRQVINVNRKTTVCNIDNARNIGVLFDATNPISFDIIRDFVKSLENNKRKIEVLGYVDDKKLIDHYLYRKGFDFITKSQLNWYNKPQGNLPQHNFITKPFDILFNLSITELFPLQYILALSKAKLKVGKYSVTQKYLDIMIDIEQEKQALNGVRKEISSMHKEKFNNKDYENIVTSKASIEIQLNFLINQLMHYLSILKK